MRRYRRSGLVDIADQIPPADVGLHHRKARRVLAIHLHRPGHALQCGDVADPNAGALGVDHGQIGKAFGIAAQGVVAANHQWNPTTFLHHRTHRHAFHLGAQGFLQAQHIHTPRTGTLAVG